MTARARVAKLLLYLAQRHGARFDVLSRRDMAEHLDLSVEETCRVLSLFAKARIIAIPNISQIEIVNRTALEAAAAAACWLSG